MPLSYKDTGVPAAEPVTLQQARQQLALDASFTADDGYIADLIIAARQYVEKKTNRAIYNRKMQLFLDTFPFLDYDSTVNPNDRHALYGTFWHRLAIRLPRPGCVSVESITYIDLTNTQQTLSNTAYYVDLNSEPARIVPMPGLYWPYTQSYLPNSVTVNYTAGTYGDGLEVDTCPMTIKQAMLLLIGHWYAFREATSVAPPHQIELGVDSLLQGEIFDSFDWS